MSALEDHLEMQMKLAGLLVPKREYRFDPSRRFRFDFAWPDVKLAVEVEGGTWTHGAHVRGAHFEADCEKYNLAGAQGWTVLRFTGSMVRHGEALRATEEFIRGKLNGQSQA